MNRAMRRRTLLAAASALVAGVGLVAVSPAQAAPQTVTGVKLRWGVNNESNNAAFAPGTVNFFSAGKVANPGEGGQLIPSTGTGATWSNGKPARWRAAVGDVTIEKKKPSGTYGKATFAGLRTSPSGASTSPPTSQVFSDHRMVFGAGSGTIDAATDSASLTWDGDVTVLYYSGMSYFHLSDPVLTLANGSGTVTATASGFASSMDDMTQWTKIPNRKVTLARLTNVDVTAKGLTTTPAYRGVTYTAAAGETPQVAKTSSNQAHWGSFPQNFVAFAQKVGAGSYWYTSGGSVDPNKMPLPLDVLVP